MVPMLLRLLIISLLCAQSALALEPLTVKPFKVIPDTRQAVQLSFAPVVKNAIPAVVNVYGSRTEKRPRSAYMDDFFREFFGRDEQPNMPGNMPRERVQRSLGSGVLVDASGFVVTNNHVIENMTEVKVALSDKREFEADIVLRDPRTDLAVLKLKNAGSSPFPFLDFGNSDALEVGDLVLAIGNPFGVGQTVTQGIVSALARTQVGVTDYQFFIQTDAAINPGNSGGALVDMNGRLAGINTAIFSRSGGSHGIGFAIPSSMVKAVVDSARGGSRSVKRPWLGARLQNVTQDIAESVGLDRPSGVLVASLFDKGPAEQAGIKRGDVILSVDGQTVDDVEAFGYRFSLKGISGETPMTIIRNGTRKNVQVALQPPPETRPRDPVKIRNRSPFGGMTLMNLSPALADEMQLETLGEGVVVQDIEPGSIAQRVGFQKGDLLVIINGAKIASSRDLEKIARDPSGVWEITLSRSGQILTTVLGG